MILVRDIFQLKFGKAKDALASIKHFEELRKRFAFNEPARYLTDLTGPYYTLVLETTYTNLAAFEASMKQTMGAKEFSKWYKGFVPLVESGRREIFTIAG